MEDKLPKNTNPEFLNKKPLPKDTGKAVSRDNIDKIFSEVFSFIKPNKNDSEKNQDKESVIIIDLFNKSNNYLAKILDQITKSLNETTKVLKKDSVMIAEEVKVLKSGIENEEKQRQYVNNQAEDISSSEEENASEQNAEEDTRQNELIAAIKNIKGAPSIKSENKSSGGLSMTELFAILGGAEMLAAILPIVAVVITAAAAAAAGYYLFKTWLEPEMDKLQADRNQQYAEKPKTESDVIKTDQGEELFQISDPNSDKTTISTRKEIEEKLKTATGQEKVSLTDSLESGPIKSITDKDTGTRTDSFQRFESGMTKEAAKQVEIDRNESDKEDGGKGNMYQSLYDQITEFDVKTRESWKDKYTNYSNNRLSYAGLEAAADIIAAQSSNFYKQINSKANGFDDENKKSLLELSPIIASLGPEGSVGGGFAVPIVNNALGLDDEGKEASASIFQMGPERKQTEAVKNRHKELQDKSSNNELYQYLQEMDDIDDEISKYDNAESTPQETTGSIITPTSSSVENLTQNATENPTQNPTQNATENPIDSGEVPATSSQVPPPFIENKNVDKSVLDPQNVLQKIEPIEIPSTPEKKPDLVASSGDGVGFKEIYGILQVIAAKTGSGGGGSGVTNSTEIASETVGSTVNNEAIFRESDSQDTSRST